MRQGRSKARRLSSLCHPASGRQPGGAACSVDRMSDDDLGELSGRGGDAAAQRLMDATWPTTASSWVVNQLIDAKMQLPRRLARQVDADGDVPGALRDYPAKVMLEPADHTRWCPSSLRAHAGVASADPHDDKKPSGEVADVIEGQVTLFVSQMSDQDNWSFGKRMWSTATAEGVDLAIRRPSTPGWRTSTAVPSRNGIRSWAILPVRCIVAAVRRSRR